MPEASRFDAGPVELSYPLARLASENLRTENYEKIEIHFSLPILTVSGNFLLFKPCDKIYKSIFIFSYKCEQFGPVKPTTGLFLSIKNPNFAT